MVHCMVHGHFIDIINSYSYSANGHKLSLNMERGSMRSFGDWTLVGCTVAPGFLFESFAMAQVGWELK